jgi:uncharacterized membrane protein
MNILHPITFAIGICGVIIIVWGVILTVVGFVRTEYRHLRGQDICAQRDSLRHRLGSYLLLGLEFLVAGDIANTIIKPTLNDLAVLGSIVAIRTVLNYFLNREMAGTHYCGRNVPGS